MNGVYGGFHPMVQVERRGFVTGTFDASICAGGLTPGRAPASSLDETVSVARRGGYVVFRVRPDAYDNNGF